MTTTQVNRVFKPGRRAGLERITAIGTNVEVKFEMSARFTDGNQEPFNTTFWTKNAGGKNSRDLLVGSDGKFSVIVKGLGTKKLRAWLHPTRPVKFSYTMTVVGGH